MELIWNYRIHPERIIHQYIITLYYTKKYQKKQGGVDNSVVKTVKTGQNRSDLLQV